MTTPADTLEDLRRDLFDGCWRRLLDPRLDLAMFEKPLWWPTIAGCCAYRLAYEAINADPKAPALVGDWAQAMVSDEQRSSMAACFEINCQNAKSFEDLFTDMVELASEGSSVRLVLLARRAVTLCPSPEREAAMVVLERWPLE